MRREKEPLEQEAVIAEGGTALPPDAGRREAEGGALHQLRTPGNVAASRRNAAARVFDQGTCDQVHPHMSGLQLFRELAVAVVAEDADVRPVFPDKGRKSADVINAERFPVGIAAGALQDHRFHAFLLQGLPNGGQIRLAGTVQLHLGIADAVKAQGPESVPFRADGLP